MHTHFADLDSRFIILSQVEDNDRLTYVVTSDLKTGRCPKCQHGSHKRHSAYMRIVDDLPIQGKSVQLYLKIRKCFCTNDLCETKVFTEWFEWLLPYKQRTSVWIKHCARLLSQPTVLRPHMSLECWACR